VVGFGISDSFEIVFDTLETTRKAINLRQNPSIAFVVWGFIPGDERSVQYEGIADEPSGTDLLIGSNERSSSVRIVRDSFVSHILRVTRRTRHPYFTLVLQGLLKKVRTPHRSHNRQYGHSRQDRRRCTAVRSNDQVDIERPKPSLTVPPKRVCTGTIGGSSAKRVVDRVYPALGARLP
jgi:hypothetical protein